MKNYTQEIIYCIPYRYIMFCNIFFNLQNIQFKIYKLYKLISFIVHVYIKETVFELY